MKIRQLWKQKYDELCKEEGIEDFTCAGECSRCGSCCSNYLPMTSKEIKEIHRYVKKHRIESVIRGNGLKAVLDKMCPFYDNAEKKCRIYAVRPYICRCFICNIDKRKMPDMEFFRKVKQVTVREEFFSQNEDYSKIH